MLFKKIRKILNVLRGNETFDYELFKKAGMMIGNNCAIQNGVQIDFNHCQHISIGNNVTIAPKAYILAHDASTKRHLNYAKIGKVIIHDNVFIGACSIIMPGVIIGENSIIGAGSVVVSSIPANVVAVGNPAHEICSLDEFISKRKNELNIYPKFDERYTLRNKVSSIERAQLNEQMNSLMKDGWGFIE